MLVLQVGVAHHHSVRDTDTGFAHLQRLVELTVLECDLHGLLGDHHVIGAHGHIVVIATRSWVVLVDFDLLHLRLSGVGIGFGDAENALGVIEGLDQRQDAKRQQAARVSQVVQGHGKLLLPGKLSALDGHASHFGSGCTTQRIRHSRVLDGFVSAIDQAVYACGHLVGRDLLGRLCPLLDLNMQARTGPARLQLVGTHIGDGALFGNPSTVGRCVEDVNELAHCLVQSLLRPDGVIHHAHGLATTEIGEIGHHREVVVWTGGIVQHAGARGHQPLDAVHHALGLHGTIGQRVGQ